MMHPRHTLLAFFLLACTPVDIDPGDTEGTTTTTSTETTGVTVASSTTSTTTLATVTSASTEVTSSGVATICGDGIIDPGEECDDAEMNHDSAACTSECKLATCGDGLHAVGKEECDEGFLNSDEGQCTSECKLAVCGDAKIHMGVESCDNGVNDGSYATCNPDCTLAPHCGDGVIQEKNGETCDGADIGTGCLGDCSMASSCLDIIQEWPEAQTGSYVIHPKDAEVSSLVVYCDMDADGGGYTMIKVDSIPVVTGADAEVFCAKYNMRLVVPRTLEHLHAIYKFATKKNIDPIVVGMEESILPASDEYLSILGIYPKITGQTCLSQPLNSVECPEWRANDDGPFWVSDIPLFSEPSTKNCDGCSMVYTWNIDGSVDEYQALNINGGYNAQWFICHADDKVG